VSRLELLVSGFLLTTLVLAAGCASKPSAPDTSIAGSCVSCHSDKELLKQTAAPVKEEKSEATSGEG